MLQNSPERKYGSQLQWPQRAGAEARGWRRVQLSTELPCSIFSNEIQAKKKGITWIKASYLRKIDFVAVLESADSLAEAGLKIWLTTTELIHFCPGGKLFSFPSKISGLTISKLKVPSVTIWLQKNGVAGVAIKIQNIANLSLEPESHEGGTGCDEGGLGVPQQG